MSSDVSAGLIRALVQHMEGAADGWESVSLIVSYFEGSYSGVHGYAYAPDGTSSPVTADAWVVQPAIEAYTGSLYEPGEALPVRFLVQFDRTKGAYEVTFEDADETRWHATPRNFRRLREELRPRL